MNSFNGIPISVSEHALSRSARVARLPIRKRRKNWRVIVELKPAAFQIGFPPAAVRLVMHPTLHKQLMAHIEATQMRETEPKRYRL